MNRTPTDMIANEEALRVDSRSSPTFGTIALRFVVLLAVIVSAFVWAWSR